MKLDSRTLCVYSSASVVAFSGISYELILATYATFLMGSTLLQYTLVFSVMMFAMGIGSLLSQRVTHKAHLAFLLAESLLAFLILISIPLLYWMFSLQTGAQVMLIALVLLFGTLIGLEIPLLNLIRGDNGSVARILFFDYFGGFLGGICFPLLLLPVFGFFRTSSALATLNLMVTIQFVWIYKTHLRGIYRFALPILTLALLLTMFYFSFGETFRKFLELRLFGIQS